MTTMNGVSNRRHHSANQVFRLMLGRKIADMIRKDASILALAIAEIESMRREPHRRKAIHSWEVLLSRPVDDVAERLSADDPEGDYLRETMPCFIALDEGAMTELTLRSRKAFEDEGVAT